MIHFCVFKWKPEGLNLLPSQKVVDYAVIGADYVNKMKSMVSRHLHAEHEFICITDDNTGLFRGIKTIPIWDDCAELGGCYRRLKFFSDEMKTLIGDRIVQCDIDTIITGDITDIVTDPAPISFYKHSQHLCNGSMWVMDAGVRSDIWFNFHDRSIEDSKNEIGTDQGWLKYYLKDDLISGKIKTFGSAEGVYDMRLDVMNNGFELPEDCRMVTFGGPRDPSQFTHLEWVKENWR